MTVDDCPEQARQDFWT